MTQDRIATHFETSLAALTQAARDDALLANLRIIAATISDAIRAGHKLLIAGNGGSAADAQHIAAEIVGRYKRERAAYAALALTTDTSALTAIANDYGFDQVFARQVQGLGQRGDVLLALSTSGRSPNIIAALQAARAGGLTTIAVTGAKGRTMAEACDQALIVPSEDTAVIQQITMVAAHAMCDAIEQALMDGATTT